MSVHWTNEDLEEMAEALQDSIAQRKQEQAELGEDPGHRETIDEQERMLRRIEEKLDRS